VYERRIVPTLRRRLADEPRRFIQIVLGARQVGKTTCVTQALQGLGLPVVSATADTPGLQSAQWLSERWLEARSLHAESNLPVVIFLDEIQKVTDWAAWVKRFWDEDTLAGRDIRAVMTGSAPLLMQQGLSESLTGRFEVVRATHWTWPECRDAFGWGLDQFIYFGGYPGSAPLIDEPARWRDYISGSIIETTVSRDILLMTRIDKPALLRRVFSLACEYAGQNLTYEKMLGQLQDAGNTTTVAHYLDLLDGCGLVTGLQKYSPEAVRRRRSSPKFVVHNTALMTAADQRDFERSRADSAWWGRLVEAAVGAHLTAIAASDPLARLTYWRDRMAGIDYEVDYVLVTPGGVAGIEVKTGANAGSLAGLAAFSRTHPGAETLVVGSGGMRLEEFFESEWVPLGAGRRPMPGPERNVVREADRP
jgi:predicted AAA+ superfamily ATPase